MLRDILDDLQEEIDNLISARDVLVPLVAEEEVEAVEEDEEEVGAHGGTLVE